MARHRRPPDSMEDDAPVPITAEGFLEVVRLFAYVRPYRRKFVAGQVCLMVSTLAGLAFPYFTGRLIDAAQRDARVAALTARLPASSLDVNTIAMVLFLALAVQAVCSYFQTYWLTEVGERSLADLRRDVYGHLIRLPMTFFSQRRVGELGSRLSADLAMIQGTMTGAIPMLLGQVIVMVGGLTLITLTSGRLTLVMLSSLPVAIGLAMIFGKRAHRVARDAQDKLADTNVIVEETLQGIASVKAFTNEDYETNRYRVGVLSMVDGRTPRGPIPGCLRGLHHLRAVRLDHPHDVVRGPAGRIAALTFGGMTQFLLYTTYLGGSMGQFGRLYGEWQRTMGSTQRVRDLLLEKPEELDGRPSVETGLFGPIVGDVSFERVTFSYPSRPGVTVLRDLSLSAEAGQRIALVGPSGAGKSTIVSLLLRFYDPDSGRVLIDGRDARDYPLHGLRSRMAIVPQDVLLFGGTIAENIAYGRPGATIDEIEDAARKANAHDFIAGFPDGYRTLVGDRGVKLSGGQRQRVAIARAILRDPAILILDEATSSLDSESESLVQQALDSLMRGRTSVIIAHRLATVRRADCIFVIKDGQAIESGTHEQLSALEGGLYRTLSELQFGHDEATPAVAAEV